MTVIHEMIPLSPLFISAHNYHCSPQTYANCGQVFQSCHERTPHFVSLSMF